MKDYLKFLVIAIPFTIGMIFSLLGLCFLVQFYAWGLDFDDAEPFWFFVLFFFIGFPTMVFGIKTIGSSS